MGDWSQIRTFELEEKDKFLNKVKTFIDDFDKSGDKITMTRVEWLQAGRPEKITVTINTKTK